MRFLVDTISYFRNATRTTTHAIVSTLNLYINVVEKVFQVHRIDPLEATLTHNFTRQDIEPDFEGVTDDIIKAVYLLEASPPHPSKYTPPFETLVPT
jgi:hypothetical protein